MTTRENIQAYLEMPAGRSGHLASEIAREIGAKTDTVSAELRKMRAAGLAQVVGETRENNRKAVLWSTQTAETPSPATPATQSGPRPGDPITDAATHSFPGDPRRMTLDEALTEADANRYDFFLDVNWPRVLPSQAADPAAAVLEPAVVATPDLATFEATAAALGFRPGEPVEVFDGCHGPDGLGPYVGVGQIVATPAEDPSLADGEYRVKLPGADMTLLGPNGDVFEAGELRTPEKVNS